MKSKSSEYTVRLARETDVPEIIELVKASWARTYDPVIGEAERQRISSKKHVPDLFLGEIRNADAAGVVAVDDTGAVIGHTGGYIRGEETFFIDHLHIDPGWYGTGVAKDIVLFLAQNIKNIAQCIELTVLSNNERALRFYEKTGFIPAKGANEDNSLAGVPSILMRLKI